MKVIDWILNIFNKKTIVEGYRIVEIDHKYVVKLFQFFLGEDIEVDEITFTSKTDMNDYLLNNFGERYTA